MHLAEEWSGFELLRRLPGRKGSIQSIPTAQNEVKPNATLPRHCVAFDAENAGGGTPLPRPAAMQPRRPITPTIAFSYTHAMDRLWTPWRYNYVSRAGGDERAGVPTGLATWPGDKACVFCNLIASADYAVSAEGARLSSEQADKAAHIVYRATRNYICLNAYPYNSGHVMIVPYEHQNSLAALDEAAALEMMRLARQTERVLRGCYRPEGLNFGMNLGEAAGAGVAGHIHLHALPRWAGDTNFMTVVAETRVLPETLDATWERLRDAFDRDMAEPPC